MTNAIGFIKICRMARCLSRREPARGGSDLDLVPASETPHSGATKVRELPNRRGGRLVGLPLANHDPPGQTRNAVENACRPRFCQTVSSAAD
jgi:hypothetical protein